MKKILTVCLMMASSVAFAAGGEKKFSIGGNVGYGMASIDSNGTSYSFSGLTYGGQLDLALGAKWSLGAEYTMMKDTAVVLIASVESSFNSIMGNVNYWFSGVGKGFYFGPRGGIVMGKTTVSINNAAGTSTDNSDTAFGAQLGYEFNLGRHFGLGLQANYNYVMADTAFSYFSFVAPLKFYF